MLGKITVKDHASREHHGTNAIEHIYKLRALHDGIDERIVEAPRDYRYGDTRIRIIEQLIDDIPEGEFYIKQKPIIKVPEGQWYYSVEGVAGEFGAYLDSRGDKSPYRMKMRPMGLTLTGALDPMLRGQKIADLITTGAAIDFVIPDIDR